MVSYDLFIFQCNAVQMGNLSSNQLSDRNREVYAIVSLDIQIMSRYWSISSGKIPECGIRHIYRPAQAIDWSEITNRLGRSRLHDAGYGWHLSLPGCSQF